MQWGKTLIARESEVTVWGYDEAAPSRSNRANEIKLQQSRQKRGCVHMQGRAYAYMKGVQQCPRCKHSPSVHARAKNCMCTTASDKGARKETLSLLRPHVHTLASWHARPNAPTSTQENNPAGLSLRSHRTPTKEGKKGPW
eukprot:2150388-Pleurochrysis_carterae.AAC.1